MKEGLYLYLKLSFLLVSAIFFLFFIFIYFYHEVSKLSQNEPQGSCVLVPNHT